MTSRTFMAAWAAALLLAGCASPPGTVHQFMDQRGFAGTAMVATIQMDGPSRDITPDMPAVLEAMKHTTRVSRIAVTPACTLNFNTGSSTPRQNMWVYIAESGDGYVLDYTGMKWFFTGATLRGFCASEFARGKPFVLNLPAPRHFEYYMPAPGQYLDNKYLPLPQSSKWPPP